MSKGYICTKCAQLYLYETDNVVKKGCKYCKNKDILYVDDYSKNWMKYVGEWSKSPIGEVKEKIKYVEKILERPLTEQEKQIYYNRSAEAAQWGKSIREESQNQPKCPTCQSTNIRKIGTLERGASVGMFGLFSKKINKTFKCNNCDYTW